MRRERRNFSGAEKMAILQEHLIDKVPVSEVCEKHGFQPTLFYHWQKKLFEQGAVVFEQPRRKLDRQKAAEARRDCWNRPVCVPCTGRREVVHCLTAWAEDRATAGTDPSTDLSACGYAQASPGAFGRRAGPDVRRDRPSLAALRDWHQSDKSLSADRQASGRSPEHLD